MNAILDILSLGLRYYIRTQINKQAQQHIVEQTRLLTEHVDTKVQLECKRQMADAINKNKHL